MKIGINKNMLEIDLLDNHFDVEEVSLKYGYKEVILSYNTFFEILKFQMAFNWKCFPDRIKRGLGPDIDTYLAYNHSKGRPEHKFLAKFNGTYWHLPNNPDVEVCITHFADIPNPKGLDSFDVEFQDLVDDEDLNENNLNGQEFHSESKSEAISYPIPA